MKMHAANPSFSYWEADLRFQGHDLVRQLRKEGFTAYFTMDAGQCVVLVQQVKQKLAQVIVP